LGGLMRDTSRETIGKVPDPGDIGIIGALFNNKQTSHERDEIIFLITPHLIYPGTQPPLRKAKSYANFEFPRTYVFDRGDLVCRID
jgi:Flp pilus assembly secretin CpaC